jgi:hypothetical protein
MITCEALFEGNSDIQPAIDGLVNGAHTAAAEPLHDAIATLQSCVSWQEGRPRVGLQHSLHLGDRLATTLTRWAIGFSIYSKAERLFRCNRQFEESK